jgi:hypothetical protein
MLMASQARADAAAAAAGAAEENDKDRDKEKEKKKRGASAVSKALFTREFAQQVLATARFVPVNRSTQQPAMPDDQWQALLRGIYTIDAPDRCDVAVVDNSVLLHLFIQRAYAQPKWLVSAMIATLDAVYDATGCTDLYVANDAKVSSGLGHRVESSARLSCYVPVAKAVTTDCTRKAAAIAAYQAFVQARADLRWSASAGSAAPAPAPHGIAAPHVPDVDVQPYSAERHGSLMLTCPDGDGAPVIYAKASDGTAGDVRGDPLSALWAYLRMRGPLRVPEHVRTDAERRGWIQKRILAGDLRSLSRTCGVRVSLAATFNCSWLSRCFEHGDAPPQCLLYDAEARARLVEELFAIVLYFYVPPLQCARDARSFRARSLVIHGARPWLTYCYAHCVLPRVLADDAERNQGYDCKGLDDIRKHARGLARTRRRLREQAEAAHFFAGPPSMHTTDGRYARVALGGGTRWRAYSGGTSWVPEDDVWEAVATGVLSLRHGQAPVALCTVPAVGCGRAEAYFACVPELRIVSGEGDHALQVITAQAVSLARSGMTMAALCIAHELTWCEDVYSLPTDVTETYDGMWPSSAGGHDDQPAMHVILAHTRNMRHYVTSPVVRMEWPCRPTPVWLPGTSRDAYRRVTDGAFVEARARAARLGAGADLAQPCARGIDQIRGADGGGAGGGARTLSVAQLTVDNDIVPLCGVFITAMGVPYQGIGSRLERTHGCHARPLCEDIAEGNVRVDVNLCLTGIVRGLRSEVTDHSEADRPGTMFLNGDRRGVGMPRITSVNVYALLECFAHIFAAAMGDDVPVWRTFVDRQAGGAHAHAHAPPRPHPHLLRYVAREMLALQTLAKCDYLHPIPGVTQKELVSIYFTNMHFIGGLVHLGDDDEVEGVGAGLGWSAGGGDRSRDGCGGGRNCHQMRQTVQPDAVRRLIVCVMHTWVFARRGCAPSSRCKWYSQVSELYAACGGDLVKCWRTLVPWRTNFRRRFEPILTLDVEALCARAKFALELAEHAGHAGICAARAQGAGFVDSFDGGWHRCATSGEKNDHGIEEGTEARCHACHPELREKAAKLVRKSSAYAQDAAAPAAAAAGAAEPGTATATAMEIGGEDLYEVVDPRDDEEIERDYENELLAMLTDPGSHTDADADADDPMTM